MALKKRAKGMAFGRVSNPQISNGLPVAAADECGVEMAGMMTGTGRLRESVHSCGMPAVFTTCVHLAISLRMKTANSSAVLPTASAPSWAIAA